MVGILVSCRGPAYLQVEFQGNQHGTSRPRDQPAPGLDFQQLLVKAEGTLGLHFSDRAPEPVPGKTTQERRVGGAGRVGGSGLLSFQGSIGFARRSYSMSV